MINKTTLKRLPLITLLTAGLVLSPAMVLAGHGDRSHKKEHYSHNDRQSHSSGQKHSNKRHYKSHGKSHKSNKKRYGHQNHHALYKHGHNNHRYDNHDNHRGHNQTTYVVNDHHYSDYSYGLDPLRFMIGLHTNNFDIIFRD